MKEAWDYFGGNEHLYQQDPTQVIFRADERLEDLQRRWRSPLFMPRWASRLLLEVVSVRVQRLQDISEEDAIAEGARHFPDLPSKHPYKQDARWSLEEPSSVDDCMGGPKWAFANYINKLHAKPREPDIWDVNPWVWALSFSVVP